MKVTYEFDQSEIKQIRQVVENSLSSGRKFVQQRQWLNVDGAVPEIDDNMLWKVHMMCLLTTQQRSGPESSINKFLYAEPFTLSLAACREAIMLEETALHLLTEAKGIRRTLRIASAVSRNFLRLEQGEWDTLRRWRDKLLLQRAESPHPGHQVLEEAAGDYMDSFHEFGPKQSRNFWQSLGLSRYTFVLDSRILRWLGQNLSIELGLLTPDGLGDVRYYRFISKILADLCTQAGVLPRMFDVAVFDSFDEGTEWDVDLIW